VLRDEAKLEYIPRLMEKKKIDAYLIQETHLARDFEIFLINDFYFIHHGPESQPAKGKRGGVAIILSPDMHHQWKQSGKAKKIFKGGSTIGNTTRILSINIRFELPPCSKKKSIENSNKKKFKNLCLTTIYFPHSGYKECEIESFYNETSSHLSNILSLRNTDHIIGADTNASIGTRTSAVLNNNPSIVCEEPTETDPIFDLLGPFGNPRLSKTGKGILNIMREFQLRAASSFFDNNNKYNTWLAPPQAPTEKRKAYQLDQIFIPKSQLCQTTNVKRKFDGASSDHAALSIDFHLLNGPLLKNKGETKST
jgi:hypothetical protein